MTTIDDHLVRLIYEAPLEPEPWRGFLRELRRRLNSGYANFAFHGVTGDRRDAIAVEDADWDCSPHGRRYRSEYAAIDPVPYLAMEPGGIYLLTDLVSRIGPAGERFHRDFLQPAGMDVMVMLHIAEPGGTRGWISVARPAPGAPFTADELALLRAAEPHLTTALRLFAVLSKAETERRLYREAVNHLAIGTVILDRRGKVIAVDEHATRIMADDAAIAVRGDRLRIVSGRGDKELQDRIRLGLTGQSPRYSHIVPLADQPQLGLLVRRIDDAQRIIGDTVPALAVHISDMRMERAVSPAQLMAQLGLTQAEASLAVQLASGHSLVEAAEALGLTEQTVRTYSKRIFAKTGTRGQPELVRLLLTSVANLAS